jgi:hypothetical protein
MIFFTLCFLALVLPINCESWYTQNLDHFNFAEKRTWQQRYFLNDRSFTGSGPIFLMVGGGMLFISLIAFIPVDSLEGAISEAYVTRFIMSEWGQEFNALQVALEHRCADGEIYLF